MYLCQEHTIYQSVCPTIKDLFGRKIWFLCQYLLPELTFVSSVTMAGMESIAVFHLLHLQFMSGLNGFGLLRLIFLIVHI